MTVQTSPLREQILQKRKKRNRKILLFLLIGAAVLAAVITAVVLLVASIRGAKGSRIPENLGNNYFREER